MPGLCFALFSILPAPVTGAPRVISLDNCADQYVLGLVPGEEIAALSPRAGLEDSYYRDRSTGVRRVAAKIETVMALAPDIVVRTWGGDGRLLQMLQKQGVKVITINDITTLDQAEPELLRVGRELGRETYAQAEAQRFRTALKDIRPIGFDRTVLYYTPSGFSAGPDTLTGDVLRRLGFRMESQNKGWYPLSPEVLLSMKPDVFAISFFDDRYAMRRVPGRHPLVRKMISETPHFTIPTRTLACGGWFVAYDLQRLSRITVK